jgi:hypothetical protein
MQVTSEKFPGNRVKTHWPAALFFALYLALGIFIFRDYGFSYDEHWGRDNGVINTNYIFKKLSSFGNDKNSPERKALMDYPDVDHGPVFEIGTTLLERVLNLEDLQPIFLLRHFCSFLLFYVSSVFFYLLLWRRFGQPLLALAGVLMLVASPRIFADSYYNAKDLPFLSMAIISCFTLQNFLKKKSLGSAVWHALACGITCDIRILGLLFPAITVFLSLLDLRLIRKGGEPATKIFPVLLVYLVFAGGFVVLFWPYLWERPFFRFSQILARSSAYPWPGDLLYLGKYYLGTQLPWHYLPVWVFISTPLLYTFFLGCGIVFGVKQLLKNGLRLYRDHREQLDLAMAGLFLTPIAATIILKLVIYDGWRHMFFLYPGFIYLAVFGFVKLYTWFQENFTFRTARLLRNSLLAVWGLGMAQIIGWMIINHPHQNVYFSIYKGPKVRERFELDYWGLSYRQGLQYLLKTDKNPEIKIRVNELPGRLNSLLFPPEIRQRLVYPDDTTQADYLLTEYRWHRQDYNYLKDKEVYKIEVDGYKILSVFKLK